MRTSAPAQIGTLLGRSGASRLLAQARSLAELDALLGRLIPAPLGTHCRVLALRDSTLVLAADSPVWAARLRFHAPSLVKQLRAHGIVKARTIQVRVRPPEMPPGTRTRQPGFRQLSDRCAGNLRQTAARVSDPGLKAALLRLASRKRPPAR